jgi:hypothetical protein
VKAGGGNGVRNISEFVIVAQDPALSAQVYSHLFGSGKIIAMLTKKTAAVGD